MPRLLIVHNDDGFFLYESRAIGRYLMLKYGNGSTLIPPASDLHALAHFEAAASVEQANFDPYAAGLVWEKIHKLFTGGKTDEARAAELNARLDGKLEGYERILSKTKYLAGDNITLAGLFHVPYGYILDEQIKSDLLKRGPTLRAGSPTSSRARRGRRSRRTAFDHGPD